MGNACTCSSKDQVYNDAQVKNTTGVGQQVVQEEEVEPGNTYYSFQDFFQSEENPSIYEYVFLKEIGKGAMSRVYLAKNEQNDELVAVKVYNNTQLKKQTLGSEETLFDSVQREINLMGMLNHRYILTIFESINSPSTNSTLMVIPYAANGTVQHCLDDNLLDFKSISICFHQIGEGLRYMHEQNMVHRDIKPDNMLCFSETYFVLSDFSVSTVLESDNQLLEDTKGSPAFLSPEECSGELCEAKPCDVWAYGVSLYSAVFGMLPFNLAEGQGRTMANTILVVTEKLENESLQFPKKLPDGLDDSVVDLLKKVLQKDPKKRPTFAEIVKHKYFKDAWPIDEQLLEEERQFNEGQDAGQ